MRSEEFYRGYGNIYDILRYECGFTDEEIAKVLEAIEEEDNDR